MLNGGLTAVDKDTRETELNEGSFIPASQILNWASLVMFETVEFVTSG
jgi:hypothetical protein